MAFLRFHARVRRLSSGSSVFPFRAVSSRRFLAAFTMTELLVAVAIVAVLASLVVSLSGKAKGAAGSAQCVGNLRQLAAGALQYCADNDGKLLNSRHVAQNQSTGEWYTLLSGDKGGPVYVPHAGFGSKKGAYFCPTNKAVTSGGSAGWTTYAYNSNLADYQHNGQVWEEARLGVVTKKIVLFKDSYRKENNGTWYIDAGARWSGDAWTVSDGVHGSAQNVVFLDGHVERVTVEPHPRNPMPQGSDCVEMKAEWFWPLN